MDLLSEVVDPAHEPGRPAEGSNQAATELAVDPDPDRSDRTVSLVESQVCLCSSLFSAQRRKDAKAQRNQALN